jgi:hypothetical protein
LSRTRLSAVPSSPGPTSSPEPGTSSIATTLGKRTTKHQTNKTPVWGLEAASQPTMWLWVQLVHPIWAHLGFFLNWRPLISSANLARFDSISWWQKENRELMRRVALFEFNPIRNTVLRTKALNLSPALLRELALP